MLLLCALIVGSSSAWADTWTKVTSTDQLVSGKDYLLVSQNGLKSLGTFTVGSQTNKDYYGTTDVTASSDKSSITDTKSAHVLTLGGTSGEWTFYDNTDKKYVSLLIDGNYVNQSASVSSTDSEKWTISISSDAVATITSKYKDQRMLQFNSSSSRWACYKSSSNQQDGVLYVKETSSSALASIAISGNYPTTFAVGDEFSHEGMIVTATYADESTSVVTNKAEFAGYDMSTTGTQTVTVSYTENKVTKTAEYSIKVKPVAGLAFSPASVDIAPGEETTVSLSKTTDATPSFVVADETIATYNSATGKVVGLKEGTTTITATSAETETYAAGEAVCTITVKKALPAGALFYEGMSGYTSTSDGSEISTSYDKLDSEDWETLTKIFPGKVLSGDADGHIKFGSGSYAGKAVTKSIALTGVGKLTYKVQRYDSNYSGNLKISVTGANAEGDRDVTGTSAWEEKTVILTGADGNVVITFETTNDNKRIRVDDILVVKAPESETQTVSSYGWATYIPTYPVQFPENRAYVVTAVSQDGKTTVEAVDNVPAFTPVLLKGEGNVTATVIDDADEPETNLLSIGTGEAYAASEYPYVLAKGDNGKAGFKLWTGDASVLKDRVVLLLDAEISASRSFLFLEDGETTAIDVRSKMDDVRGEYFNLNGQRVAQPTKGLYIVNGKKVVVK